MVTRDDLEQLVKNRGQEAVGAAVVKIPDEDVRPALMLMVMIYQKSDEINRELFRRDQKRIAELEEELKKSPCRTPSVKAGTIKIFCHYEQAAVYRCGLFPILGKLALGQNALYPNAILPDWRPFLCCLYFKVLIAIQPEM